MIIIKKLCNKYCPFILLTFLIITLAYTAYTGLITAQGKSGFYESDELWKRLNNNIDATLDDTYPYNSSSATITSVSLDQLYGNRRDLANYFGEVPYEETRDNDGEPIDLFSGVYAKANTNIWIGHDKQDFDDEEDVRDYWGFCEGDDKGEVTADGKVALNSSYNVTRNDLEQVNASEIVSLRLYALSNADDSWFDNIFYTLVSFLAMFAGWIVKLVILLKNIDMGTILEAIGLENLYDVLTKTLIYNSETSQLSAFTGFAIIFFMLAIIGFVYRYVKGLDKTNGLTDIFVLGLLSLLIIGMCLSGKVYTLGSALSNISSNIMYAVAGSVSGVGGAWTTEIDDDENENKVINIQESSMINKAYVDLQICTQFGVDKISQLNFSNLGDTNGKMAKSVLITDGKSTGKVDLKDNFNNNLGYYYWFANSSASTKTDLNAEYPSTNSGSVERKMNSVVTYMQKAYNYNVEHNKTKPAERLRKMTLSLADPNGFLGVIKMILLTAVLIALAICVFKYAMMVIINKLGVFFSLIGLTAAGPMILTNNKTLVKYGKMIVMNILMCIIKLTVYSMLFDVILFIIASLLQNTTITTYLITFALLILFMKLKPLIDQMVKKFLDGVEQKIDAGGRQTRQAMKMRLKEATGARLADYDNKQRVIGHDENGNAIYGTNKGSLASKIAHNAHNMAFNEGGVQTRTSGQIKRQQAEAAKANSIKLADAQYNASKQNYENAKLSLNQEANNIAAQYNKDKKELEQEIMQTDANGNTTYNTNKLSADELKLYNQMADAKVQKDAINQSMTYQQLIQKEASGQKLTDDEKQLKTSFIDSAKKFDEAHKDAQQKLNESINKRTKLEAYLKNNLDSSIADPNDAAKKKAQDNQKNNISTAINNFEQVTRDAANTRKQSSKIGAKSEINSEAIKDYIQVQQDKQDLANGNIIQDNLTKENKEVANNIIHKNNIDTNLAQNEDVTTAKRSLDKAKHNVTKADTREAKDAAKAKVKNARAEYEQTVKQAKDTAQSQKNDMAGINISEQIDSVLAATPNKGGSGCDGHEASANKSKSLNLNITLKNKK